MIIAKVKLSPDQPVAGYLALHQEPDGTWVPLSSMIYSDADRAMAACRNTTYRMLEDAIDSLEIAQRHVARLGDQPGPHDQITIHDQPCIPDREGALTMPAKKPPPGSRHLDPDFTIADDLYDALSIAMELSDIPRPAATRLVVDALLNTPIELLIAVSETHPQRLGDVAALLVEAARATDWDNEEIL